jgi:uncharacterized membrane protein YeaQ/YmgE (transglycosylase-associated protein family)
MTIPAVLFGIFLSTLYGALFHFWRGGETKRLILYLVLSWVGFWVGQLLGTAMGWTFAEVGSLNLGMATLGSAIFLGVGYWLSLVEVDRKKKR